MKVVTYVITYITLLSTTYVCRQRIDMKAIGNPRFISHIKISKIPLLQEKILRPSISSHTNVFCYFAMIGQRVVRAPNSNAPS